MKKQFAVIVFKYFTTFFLPILLVAVLPFAYAVEITHNGNVVQSDDFETGVVGNNPNDPPWKGKNGGAMDNSNLNVRIADSNPPAAQGSNYLVLDRAGNSGTDGRAYIEGFDTLDSGVVGANFSLLLPSTNSVGVTNSSEGNIGLGPNMSGGLYLGLGQKNASGQFKIDYFDAAASTWVDSGLTYAYDTWQVWEMSVNEDTGDATLAIDGDSINFNIGRVDFGVNRLEIEGGFAGASGPPHNQIFIDAAGQPAVFSEFTWIGDNGDWNNAGNWDSPGFPDTQAHSAIFGDSIGSEQTIFSNTPVTVNSIRFNNANTHAVAGTGSFNLAATTENPPVSPTLQVDQGDHQFQAAVNLVNDTTATIASGASLSINNQLDLGGNVLTKTGDGTLSVNNALITGNGGSIANNSGVLAGVGTVGGNVDNLGGTVAPGNSPGVLTVNGNYTQGSGGTLEIEVTGTSPGESGHDQLSVTGAASLDGTLDIVPQAPYADPSVRGASENMVILTAGTVTGTFGTVNYDGNALTADFGPDANGSIRDHVGSGLFRSVIYSDSNVTVQNLLALEGDADGDKDVDITDFNSLSTNFDPGGNNSATNDWIHADFDLDGDIDITDFNALSANFAPGGYAASSPGQIPEPTTSVLLILGLASAILAFRGNGIFRCEG